MFAGLGMRGRGVWADLTFSFKYFFVTSLIFLIFTVFEAYYLIDNPELTIYDLQLWRPFFSFYGQQDPFFGTIGVLFAFIWFLRLFPLIEKTYSTTFIFIDIFIQNLFVHFILNVFGVLFLLMFDHSKTAINWLFGWGWFPMVVIYSFKKSALDPQSHTSFCCLPFLIKRKYIPWILTAFSFILATQLFFMMLIATLLGYFQSMVKKSNVIKLPFNLYQRIENCLPKSLKKRADFVCISSVEQKLKEQCWKPSQGRSESASETDFNKMKQSQGVAIDNQHGKNQDFANYWKNKGDDEEKQNQQQKESKQKEDGGKENYDLDWK